MAGRAGSGDGASAGAGPAGAPTPRRGDRRPDRTGSGSRRAAGRRPPRRPAADETTVMPTVADGVPVRYLAPDAPWAAAVDAVAGGTRLQPAAVARVQLRYDDEKADLVHDEEWEAVLVPLTAMTDPTAAHAVDYDDRDLVTEAPRRRPLRPHRRADRQEDVLDAAAQGHRRPPRAQPEAGDPGQPHAQAVVAPGRVARAVRRALPAGGRGRRRPGRRGPAHEVRGQGQAAARPADGGRGQGRRVRRRRRGRPAVDGRQPPRLASSAAGAAPARLARESRQRATAGRKRDAAADKAATHPRGRRRAGGRSWPPRSPPSTTRGRRRRPTSRRCRCRSRRTDVAVTNLALVWIPSS